MFEVDSSKHNICRTLQVVRHVCIFCTLYSPNVRGRRACGTPRRRRWMVVSRGPLTTGLRTTSVYTYILDIYLVLKLGKPPHIEYTLQAPEAFSCIRQRISFAAYDSNTHRALIATIFLCTLRMKQKREWRWLNAHVSQNSNPPAASNKWECKWTRATE